MSVSKADVLAAWQGAENELGCDAYWFVDPDRRAIVRDAEGDFLCEVTDDAVAQFLVALLNWWADEMEKP